MEEWSGMLWNVESFVGDEKREGESDVREL